MHGKVANFDLLLRWVDERPPYVLLLPFFVLIEHRQSLECFLLLRILDTKNLARLRAGDMGWQLYGHAIEQVKTLSKI